MRLDIRHDPSRDRLNLCGFLGTPHTGAELSNVSARVRSMLTTCLLKRLAYALSQSLLLYQWLELMSVA